MESLGDAAMTAGSDLLFRVGFFNRGFPQQQKQGDAVLVRVCEAPSLSAGRCRPGPSPQGPPSARDLVVLKQFPRIHRTK